MISPRDIIKRMGAGGRLVPFFKCVCVYFALGTGGAGPSLVAVAAKCAPVLCLLLVVALHHHSLPPQQYSKQYARRVCIGLALSALGDALLVWPGQLMTGMGAFAGAHVAYLGALGWRRPRAPRVGALLITGCALYLRVACRGARGPMAVLVPIYAVLLTTMAWRALARRGPAAVGGLLFLISDAILGYMLFTGPVPYGQVLVMSTYYLGQLGIAVSALRASPGELVAA